MREQLVHETPVGRYSIVGPWPFGDKDYGVHGVVLEMAGQRIRCIGIPQCRIHRELIHRFVDAHEREARRIAAAEGLDLLFPALLEYAGSLPEDRRSSDLTDARPAMAEFRADAENGLRDALRVALEYSDPFRASIALERQDQYLTGDIRLVEVMSGIIRTFEATVLTAETYAAAAAVMEHKAHASGGPFVRGFLNAVRGRIRESAEEPIVSGPGTP